MKKGQRYKILKVLQDANGEWINGRYFNTTMMISQYHTRIKELQEEGYNIEPSTFRDEYRFKSYRLIKKTVQTFNKEKELEKPVHVEKMQFTKSPTRQLYMKQKLEGSNWQCIHAPRFRKTISKLDFNNDTTLDIEVCSACGKEF